jgi:ABC-2 type transport system permease protein
MAMTQQQVYQQEEEIAHANNKVPNSLSQTRITIKYEFLNYIRSRRFLILLTVVLVISGALTAVVGYYRPASFTTSSLSFLSNYFGNSAPYVAVLSGIFFGGDAISGEFQNKTGYYLLPNPTRRASIYFGKWFAALIASTIVLAIFSLTAVGNVLFYFGANFPGEFAYSLAFSWVYLISVLGFAFFFSSLFKNSSYSILVTAILFLFGFTIIENVLARLADVEPWFLVTYGSQIIGNVLNNPYPQHVVSFTNGAGATLNQYSTTIPEGLAIMGIYFVVTAVLGLVLFEKKEFN